MISSIVKVIVIVGENVSLIWSEVYSWNHKKSWEIEGEGVRERDIEVSYQMNLERSKNIACCIDNIGKKLNK